MALMEELDGGAGVLAPTVATLSLLSCGVMATAMLASALKKASWTPYLLLWAAAETVMMLAVIVEAAVTKVSWRSCVVYMLVLDVAHFLSRASAMALSVDRVVRALRPSLYAPRGSLDGTICLLFIVLLLYCPAFTITGFKCAPKFQDRSTLRDIADMYLHVNVILVGIPEPLVVSAGVVSLWWRREQSPEVFRLLAPFLSGFLLLDLPLAVFSTKMLISIYQPDWIWGYHLRKLSLVVNVCFLIKPLVLLGCLNTSSQFRGAFKYAIRLGRDKPVYTDSQDSRVVINRGII